MTRLVPTNSLLVKVCWIRFAAATQASVNMLELNHPTGILLCHYSGTLTRKNALIRLSRVKTKSLLKIRVINS